ncbi:hypothetical protein [Aliarcobacter butzleri]|uniref:hypothetical protein n=1 Tax=Aliarcobacter butzleri TaxID=28197 RepID=UPI002739EA01|nr:hypothetical protein [Aliarcobacter butzleri]
MLKKLILFVCLLTNLSFAVTKEKDNDLHHLTTSQQERLNTLVGKANGNIEVVNPTATVQVADDDFNTRYDKAMADLELKNKIEELYKAPSDYNPEDLTFADKAKALLRSSNMTYAYATKQIDMNKEIGEDILAKYSERPLSQKEISTEILNTNLTGFNKFIEDNPVNSWEDLERKKEYYKGYLKDLNIVANEIPLALSIPSSIVAGIFDIYILLILILVFATPIKIYIFKLFQDLSTNGKIKIAIFSIGTGILYGAIFSYSHKAITGIKVSNHLEYSLFLGAIIFSIIAIIYTLSLSKRQKENITEQYNTIFIKKMLSYNTNLEQKIYNQNSVTQAEHAAIIIFLIGFFGYLYFSKGGKSESFRQTHKYFDDKILHKFEDLGYKNIYHFLENYTNWKKNYIDQNIKLIKEYKFHNAQGYNTFINLGLQVAFHLFQEYKHSSTLKSFGVIIPTEQIAMNLMQEFNFMLDELNKSTLLD